jgi:hypothetical protein
MTQLVTCVEVIDDATTVKPPALRGRYDFAYELGAGWRGA